MQIMVASKPEMVVKMKLEVAIKVSSSDSMSGGVAMSIDLTAIALIHIWAVLPRKFCKLSLSSNAYRGSYPSNS